jgi:hypothetical protein
MLRLTLSVLGGAATAAALKNIFERSLSREPQRNEEKEAVEKFMEQFPGELPGVHSIDKKHVPGSSACIVEIATPPPLHASLNEGKSDILPVLRGNRDIMKRLIQEGIVPPVFYSAGLAEEDAVEHDRNLRVLQEQNNRLLEILREKNPARIPSYMEELEENILRDKGPEGLLAFWKLLTIVPGTTRQLLNSSLDPRVANDPMQAHALYREWEQHLAHRMQMNGHTSALATYQSPLFARNMSTITVNGNDFERHAIDSVGTSFGNPNAEDLRKIGE